MAANMTEVVTTMALVQFSSLSFLRSLFSKLDPCLCSHFELEWGRMRRCVYCGLFGVHSLLASSPVGLTVQ